MVKIWFSTFVDCPENGELIALLDLMCTILNYPMYLRSQRQLDISMMLYSYDMFVLDFTCQYLCIISVMTDISLFILFL